MPPRRPDAFAEHFGDSEKPRQLEFFEKQDPLPGATSQSGLEVLSPDVFQVDSEGVIRDFNGIVYLSNDYRVPDQTRIQAMQLAAQDEVYDRSRF